MATSLDDVVELLKLAGGPSAVIGLGWWLRGKFVDITAQGKQILAEHEKMDERRHRQNLVRFAKINMKLGISDANSSNGNHDYDDDDGN